MEWILTGIDFTLDLLLTIFINSFSEVFPSFNCALRSMIASLMPRSVYTSWYWSTVYIIATASLCCLGSNYGNRSHRLVSLFNCRKVPSGYCMVQVVIVSYVRQNPYFPSLGTDKRLEMPLLTNHISNKCWYIPFLLLVVAPEIQRLYSVVSVVLILPRCSSVDILVEARISVQI